MNRKYYSIRRNENTHKEGDLARRKTKINRIEGPTLVSTLRIFKFCVCAHYLTYGAGVEINATSEWKLLKEGDTIPAGLHIKVDLNSGKKWVKLVEDDDQNIKSINVLSDGSLAIIDENNERNPDELMDQISEPNYDYLMMHRTLSKLDFDELDRFGGLPSLPSSNADAGEVQVFKNQMKAIWTDRQKELKKLEVEMLADIPKILKSHIYAIHSYIHEGVVLSHPDNSNSETFSNIEFVLSDLEYQLSDLDMARDFYKLEGWHLLVYLLSEGAHVEAIRVFENSTLDTTKAMEYVYGVKAAAAWVIGTTIKNIDEFFSWTIEDISYLNNKIDSNGLEGAVTVIDLLLHQLEHILISSPCSVKELPETDKKVCSKASTSLLRKITYALGSVLRLNSLGQQQFVKSNGPNILFDCTMHLLHGSGMPPSVTLKIFILTSDLILEESENSIVSVFKEKKWCDALSLLLNDDQSLNTANDDEKLLIVIKKMAPWCKTHWDLTFHGAVMNIVERWNLRIEIDEEWKSDVIDLSKIILQDL